MTTMSVEPVLLSVLLQTRDIETGMPVRLLSWSVSEEARKDGALIRTIGAIEPMNPLVSDPSASQASPSRLANCLLVVVVVDPPANAPKVAPDDAVLLRVENL